MCSAAATAGHRFSGRVGSQSVFCQLPVAECLAPQHPETTADRWLWLHLPQVPQCKWKPPTALLQVPPNQSQQPLTSNWSFAERDNIVRPSDRPSAPNRIALHFTSPTPPPRTSLRPPPRIDFHRHNGRQAHHWCMLATARLSASALLQLQPRPRPARPIPG